MTKRIEPKTLKLRRLKAELIALQQMQERLLGEIADLEGCKWPTAYLVGTKHHPHLYSLFGRDLGMALTILSQQMVLPPMDTAPRRYDPKVVRALADMFTASARQQAQDWLQEHRWDNGTAR